jgi:hypothetical protein
MHHVRSLSSDDTLHGYDLIIWNLSTPRSRIDEDDLDRRRKEFRHHLAARRPVVVFLGFDDDELQSDESLLREFLGLDLRLSRGKGTHPEIIHPGIRELAEWARNVTEFRAYMDDPPGTPLLRIPKTTHVVGSVAQSLGATVLLLPRISESVSYGRKESGDASAASDLLDMIVEAVQEFDGDESLPEWSSEVVLPGEDGLLRALEKDRQTLERTQARIDRRRMELATLRRRKLLVTGEGSALERIAGEAFSALGFEVLPSEPGRADLTLELGKRRAVVEVKGKTRSAAEKDALQAAKWVLNHQVEYGRKAKGILLVNGWRTRAVDARPAVFPDQMLKTVEQHNLSLVTGQQLLGFWSDVESQPRKAKALVRQIMNSVGPLEA